MKKLLTTTALTIALFSSTANAVEITAEQFAALQKQIADLQQEVKELKQQRVASNAGGGRSNAELEERVNFLERKQEINEEVAKNNAERYGTVEYGNKGLTLTGADKRYQLRVRGYAQADSRSYFDDVSNNGDSFLIRQARPTFEFKLPGDLSGRLTTDFGSGSTRLVDAYADWKANNFLTLRAGKFKSPIGLEKWQSDTEGLFVERGLTNNFVTARDIGFGAFGEIVPGVLEYQLAGVDGGADGADVNADTSGSKDVIGRIFTQPFKNSSNEWLQGFGVGIAGQVGQRDGTTTNTELTSGYRTTGQNSFFTYSAGTFANGKVTKVNPQAWYYKGPFGILGEYFTNSQEVRNGATDAELEHEAWLAAASYVLTGEDASFDGVKPANDFNPEKGHWGAFELVARLSQLDIDDASFGTFATATSSATSVDERIVGLNWHISQNMKIAFDYSQNSFEGGAAGGADRPDEKVGLVRVQFKF